MATRTKTVVVLVALLTNVLVAEPARADTRDVGGCTDYKIVGVRGSGQGYNGPHEMSTPVGQAAELVAQRLISKRTPNGQISYTSLVYPAVAVNWSAITGGYWDSMEEGVTNLVGALNANAANCPASKTILIGYSQGAQVIHTALDRQITERARGAIGSVLIISDPVGVNNASYTYYLDSITGERLGAYGVGGILDSARVNSQFVSRTVAICLKRDLVCSKGTSTSVHGRYDTVGTSVNVLQHYSYAAADRAYVSPPAGSRVLRYLDGTLQVYQRSASGDLHRWHYGGGWVNESMGDPISSPPTAVQYNSQLSVFARGSSNTLLHRFWHGTGWSTGENLGGSLVGIPAVTTYSDGSLQAFGRNAGGTLQHWWYSPSAGWVTESFGESISGDPFVVEYAGRLHVFALSGSTLYHRWWTGNGWQTANRGGAINGDPTAVVYNGQLSVFANGADNALKHYFAVNDSAWSYEGLAGGSVTGRPTAVSYLDGSLQVYARSTGGTLQHWYYSDGWNYDNVGNSITTDPVVVQYNMQLSIFAGAPSGSLLHVWWNGGWYSQSLGGSVIAGYVNPTESV
jgi:hypothetical protein